MIKRALAAALCLLMVFALLPKTARADDADVTLIFDGDKLHLEGSASKYKDEGVTWSVDSTTSPRTLTLTNFHFTTSAATALQLPADTILKLNGTNTVTSTAANGISSVGIRCLGTLTIKYGGVGPGTLTAQGGRADGSAGLRTNGTIKVSGVSVTGKGGTATADGSHGVYAEDGDVVADGGSITGMSGVAERSDSYGVLAANGNVTVKSGGSITGACSTQRTAAKFGIGASGSLTLINGRLTGESIRNNPDDGAMKKAPALPQTVYYWRTSKSAAYTKSSVEAYTWDIATQTYIDIRTSLPSAGVADVPKTGDPAQPVLWLGIVLLAGAGLAASVVRRRKRQNG